MKTYEKGQKQPSFYFNKLFYWTEWNTIFPCEFCCYIQLFYLKTHVSGSFLDWRKNETNHKIRERTHFITIAVIYFDNLKWYSSKNANLVKRCLQKQPPEVFCKKHVLRNSVKLTGKHLCQSFFFNKVAGLRCFPVSFEKFPKTPFHRASLGDCFYVSLKPDECKKTFHI